MKDEDEIEITPQMRAAGSAVLLKHLAELRAANDDEGYMPQLPGICDEVFLAMWKRQP